MRRSRQAKKHRLQKCSSRQKNEREPPQAPTPEVGAADQDAEIGHGQGGRRFFACYLLTSLSPRYKGHTYIGFTVNPKRRIRQHNGEITSGAFRTKRKRPWEMVFCIHGFLTHVSALQFEWAWQHPKESLAVREAASTFKTLGGLANKIKLALTMLTLPSWQSMDLTVSFFSTAYMKHTAGCPSLPPQMKLHFCSMDELPCYWSSDCDEDGIDSNRSGDCGDLDDDMQVSSVDGTVEMSHSSVDTERFSIENASENTWTLDQRDLGVPLLRESSPMVGDARVEADEQLVQSIHQTDPSDKESFAHPMLEEDMTRSAGSSGNKQIRHSSEIGTECQRDSFSLLKELEEPSEEVSASVEGELLSTLTKNCAKEDKMACIVIDEDISEYRHPTCEQLPVRMRDDVRPSSMETVEVIDLFTPSPECRIISGSRRRRAARDDPDIIDLTRSPLFVQL